MYFVSSFAFSGEISYKECSTFNDMSGPAMINTFNDINKLVQARKLWNIIPDEWLRIPQSSEYLRACKFPILGISWTVHR